MKKKVLSMLLCFLMVLSMVPTTLAAEPADSGGGSLAVEDTLPEAAQAVQKLIDALPDADAITAENAEEVTEQLDAIDEAKDALSDTELAALDFTRYDAAVAALNALNGEGGAEDPEPAAENAAVAKIGDTEYASLTAALKAAKSGETITLCADTDLGKNSFSFYDSKSAEGSSAANITLDLGGYTLTSSKSTSVITIAGEGFTLKNGAVVSTSTSTSSVAVYVSRGSVTLGEGLTVSDAAYGLRIYRAPAKTATVTVSGAAISGSTAGAVVDTPSGSGSDTGSAKLIVESGSVSGGNSGIEIWGATTSATAETPAALEVKGGTVSGEYYGIAGGGDSGYSDTSITISGGTVKATDTEDGTAIYHPQSGTLTLTGGTIEGATGVQMCSGSLVIPEDSTVTIKATGKDTSESKGTGDGSISDGAAISIVDRSYAGGAPTATIEAGTFTSEYSDAITAYTWSSGTASEISESAAEGITVSGGTFSSEVPATLLADGYSLKEKADGTYGVKETGVAAAPENGTGTAADPYQITTAEELLWFANQVNSGSTSICGILMNDIDLSTVCSSALATSWTPIGNYGSDTALGYAGTFDGNGKTISGLYIDGETDNYCGLFGNLKKGSVVKDLTVSGAVTVACQYVGGIAGATDGTITNCVSNVALGTGTKYVGGIAGASYADSKIELCTNNAVINAGSGTQVGGIVGTTAKDGAVVDRCVNYGSVAGAKRVGGIVGNNLGTVSNCFNHYKAEVSASTQYAGGIVGYNSSGTITSCVQGEADVVGGKDIGRVVGNNTGTVTNCYYLNTDDSTEESDSVDGTTVKTLAQAKSGEVVYLLNSGVTDGTQAWYQVISDEGEDPSFTSTGSNTVYPYYSCKDTTTPASYSNKEQTTIHSFDDNGICENCGKYQPAELNDDGIYEISNAGQLAWFAALVNGDTTDAEFDAQNKAADAVLTADIDLSVLGMDSWTPIGDYSSNKTAYTGTFDGGGNTIENLSIDSTSNYSGLFGVIGNGGTVKNLYVTGKVTSTGKYVGGIAGGVNGTVTSCTNKASVIGESGVGGIAGVVNGTVDRCVNYCNVTGTDKVGGIAGYNRKGTVSNCLSYSVSSVTGTSSVGGIVGSNQSTITSCFEERGTVTGGEPTGRVVGNNTGTVTNCYYLNTDDSTDETDSLDGTTVKTLDQTYSGEVCYLLNSGVTDGTQAWYQDLSYEDDPFPYSKDEYTVYENNVCDGTKVVYSNTKEADKGHTAPDEITESDWSWVQTSTGYNGVLTISCSVCGEKLATLTAEATSTTVGNVITYTATVTYDGEEYTGTYTVTKAGEGEDSAYEVKVITNGGKSKLTVEADYDEVITITAEATDKYGKSFVGWYQDVDGDGECDDDEFLSTKNPLRIYVKSDMTMIAKYGTASAANQVGRTLTVSDRTYASDDTSSSVLVTLRWDLPDDCELVEAGILRCYASEKPDADSIVEGADGVKKKASTLTDSTGTYSLKVASEGDFGDEDLYVRGYVTYTDANGDEQTVYTTVQKSALYNN